MDLALLLITLGAVFLTGLAADQAGRLTRLPRVTMLLLVGLAAGSAGLDLIPRAVSDWFPALSTVALTMVAFLMGGALTGRNLARHGRAIMVISLAIVAATLLIVAGGLMLAGLAPALALILAVIATSTAPAAISDVIRQSGLRNGFTDTLRGIVAIDDAWGLIAFSIVLALVGQANGMGGVLAGATRDLGGGIALGCAIGLPAAYLSGRLQPGDPLQAEAIGIVFLAAGLALWCEVSFLVTGITAGAVIANLARHHRRAFHEIEHIQWPFLILFFLLAGASLDLAALREIGLLGALYIGLRIAARLIGGQVGARAAGLSATEAAWYGPALLPQAGVAVGMGLVAGDALPNLAAPVMAFTIASTVVFEILGPPLTLLAIRRLSPGTTA